MWGLKMLYYKQNIFRHQIRHLTTSSSEAVFSDMSLTKRKATYTSRSLILSSNALKSEINQIFTYLQLSTKRIFSRG